MVNWIFQNLTLQTTLKINKNGNLLVGAVATIGDATISDSYFVNNSGRWGGALSVMGGESSSATKFHRHRWN